MAFWGVHGWRTNIVYLAVLLGSAFPQWGQSGVRDRPSMEAFVCVSRLLAPRAPSWAYIRQKENPGS